MKIAINAFVFFALASVAWGQSPKTEDQAYCQFMTEQGKAQAVILRTPSAMSGITQPTTGTIPQLFVGARGSVQDIRKSGMVMEAARKNCDLYKATTDAVESIQYASDALEKEALQNRVSVIDGAIRKFQALMDENNKRVEAGTSTKFALYALQSGLTRLIDERGLAQRSLATKFDVDLNGVPIHVLTTSKDAAEVANQKAVVRLERENNWDLQWEAGVHKTINSPTNLAPGIHPSGPFAGVSFMYNFGSRSSNKHLAASETAYIEWKRTQNSDVQKSADTLRLNVVKAIGAEEDRLRAIHAQQQAINDNLTLLNDSSSNAGVTFVNQLTADKIILSVEEDDAAYRYGMLTHYLDYNFPDQVNKTAVPGLVSITFDDGFQTAFDAAPILDKAGLKATYYIISKRLGESSYMSADEVKDLAARGHEIGSHTRNHQHLPKLTVEQQKDEIVGTVADFNALGLHPTSFAYPFGEYNDDSIAAVKAAGFTSARTVNADETGADPYKLQGFPISNTTTVAELKYAIDSAVRSGTWLILLYHRVDVVGNAISVRHEDLQAVVDYLVQNKVKVVTVNDGVGIPNHCHSGSCREENKVR